MHTQRLTNKKEDQRSRTTGGRAPGAQLAPPPLPGFVSCDTLPPPRTSNDPCLEVTPPITPLAGKQAHRQSPPRPKTEEVEQHLAEDRMEDEGGPPSGLCPPDDSRSETRKARRPGNATALTVGNVMTKHVRWVSGDMPIKEVALILAGEGIGAVPVAMPDRRLLGIVTDRDIVIRVCAGDKSVDDLRASDAMTADPTGISADKTVADALALMARLQVHRLPVVDENFHLMGMISTADIASCSDCGDDLLQALEEISNRRSFWNRVWR